LADTRTNFPWGWAYPLRNTLGSTDAMLAARMRHRASPTVTSCAVGKGCSHDPSGAGVAVGAGGSTPPRWPAWAVGDRSRTPLGWPTWGGGFAGSPRQAVTTSARPHNARMLRTTWSPLGAHPSMTPLIVCRPCRLGRVYSALWTISALFSAFVFGNFDSR